MEKVVDRVEETAWHGGGGGVDESQWLKDQ
jgi:hypothetical protein